jgi:hypothetical protein
MTSVRTAAALIAFAAAGLALAPTAMAQDRYGSSTRSQSSAAYSDQRTATSGGAWRQDVATDTRGEPCRAYCLPPGYTLEPSSEPPPPAGYDGRPVGDPGVDYRYTDGSHARDDRYGERRTWEGESRYVEEGQWSYAREDYSDEGYDDRRDDAYRCPRSRDERDDRSACGEIRLSDGFFYGATGGVGPDYIDAGGGGGGGYVMVGGGANAGAGAYASARASVGVSIRIGGRRGGGGHPEKPGGGHPPKGGGGCGCGH